MTKKTMYLLVIICSCLIGITSCQTNNENKNPTIGKNTPSKNTSIDTIRLKKNFMLKNVVSYKLSNASIIVKQADFEKKLRSIWAHYKEGMKDSATEDKEFKKIYTSRFKALDSTLQLFKLSQKPNIIYLDHKFFEKFEFRPLMEFEEQIETDNCAIIDNKNKRQYQILKRNFSWHHNEKDAGAGRRYFLIGETTFFYETIDSIS